MYQGGRTQLIKQSDVEFCEAEADRGMHILNFHQLAPMFVCPVNHV